MLLGIEGLLQGGVARIRGGVCVARIPSSVVIAESISLSWKVQPLWMPKLVPNEREICLSPKTQRYQTYQLMQSHSPVDDSCPWRHGGHVCVQLGVHEPVGQCLVANEGLVVAFCIRHTFLIVSADNRDNAL